MPKSQPTKHFYVEVLSQPARHDIPSSLAREIGRFIVTWSYIENCVQDAIYRLLELTPAEGRIALRERRITDRLDMLRDLGQLRERTGDYVLLASIRNRCEARARHRHLMAHSIWTKTDSEWVARLTRGAWDDSSKGALPDAPKGSKVVTPESIPVTVENLREWRMQTENLIRDFRRLPDQHTVVQKPSPRKSR